MAFGNLAKKPNIVPIVTDQERAVMHRPEGWATPACGPQLNRAATSAGASPWLLVAVGIAVVAIIVGITRSRTRGSRQTPSSSDARLSEHPMRRGR